MKQFVYILLLINFLALEPAALAISIAESENKLYKTGVQVVESKGLKLQLLPETIVDTNLSLEGDFFSALLSNNSSNILGIPHGSRLLGKVTQITRPRPWNRGAKVKVHTDQLMLADGSLVKINADFSSKASWADKDKPKVAKSITKELIKDTGTVTASTMVGAVDAIQYGGIGTAIATSGVSVLVGAGLGLGLGLYEAWGKAGNELISSGFSPLFFKLESDFELLEDLPLLSQRLEPVSASLLGINIKVRSISKYFSQDYGDFLLMDVELVNNSLGDLFLGDFVLSSARRIRPVLANPLISNSSLSSISVKDAKSCKLAFSLGSINKDEIYKLMMVNPVTQEIVANLEVDFKQYI